MGLFSKKKESHTIEEAIKNDDEKFFLYHSKRAYI